MRAREGDVVRRKNRSSSRDAVIHRISFDTNEIIFDSPTEARYDLSFPTSVAELAQIGADLRDGLRVIIYMPDELEMEAALVFDRERDAWTARPIAGTTTYLDGQTDAN